jgi:hypothetical protein
MVLISATLSSKVIIPSSINLLDNYVGTKDNGSRLKPPLESTIPVREKCCVWPYISVRGTRQGASGKLERVLTRKDLF